MPFFCGSSANSRTRPTTTGPDEVTDPLHGLDLEPGADEPVGHRAPGLALGQRDVLAQPGQRDPHQISIPNGRVKRTSPSTMSRMSSTPWRNIRVRSMPIPNAKPV